MPADIPIPIPVPLVPDRIGLRALNIRTANGVSDRYPDQTLIPAGTVFVAVQPGEWADQEFVRDRDSVVIPDAVAWLTELATGGSPLAATAAAKFAEVQAGLLWLTRLRLSQDGVCDPPPE